MMTLKNQRVRRIGIVCLSVCSLWATANPAQAGHRCSNNSYYSSGGRRSNNGYYNVRYYPACRTVVSTCQTVAVAHRRAESKQTKDIVDTAVGTGSFKTLAAALKAAGLVDVLKSKGPFTVFAPTDQAFSRLPAGTVKSLLRPENKAKLQSILKYHVVAGKVLAKDVVKLNSAKTVAGPSVQIRAAAGKVMVDNAKVVKTDIACSNGVIHVIDAVMLPKDIVDTAVSAGSFKTLLTAVKAAGLMETLKGDGPFTVFAPTDKAFGKLDPATLKSLLKPENKSKLQAILKYHVVPGKVLAADVIKLKSAKTVQGQSVSIKLTGGKVMVDGATTIDADIVTANGVIHVIDSVILPK